MPCNIEDVKAAHAKLLTEVLSNQPTSEKYEENRLAFIVEAEKLVKDIESCATQVTTSDDYTWLSTAAVQWQSVFSSVLGIPRNIEIAPPPQPVTLPAEKTIADDKQVTAWIGEIAHYLSKIRRAQNILHDVGEVLQRVEEGDGGIDSASITEDWHRATVQFASEVIDGRVNFIQQLGEDAYYRLESVWLKDVKELNAYFMWRHKKRGADENYYMACEQIRQRLLTCVKGTTEDFQNVRAYIESHYLTNGVVRQDVNAIVKNIIGIKAKRVWERTGGIYTPEANWVSAETYTKMFYENIIPAVTTKRIDRVADVLMAFGFSKAPEHRYLVINAFEAAIAVYFLDPNIIRELVDRKAVAWNMVL